jgi:hypothetical protein
MLKRAPFTGVSSLAAGVAAITIAGLAGCGQITVGPAASDGGDAGAADIPISNGDAPVDAPAIEGGGGGDSGPAVTVDQACADLDNSLCDALAACSKFVLELSFGDKATCVSRNNLSCVASQQAAGIGGTPADLESCASAIPAASCADLIGHKMIGACRDRPGTVSNGMTCGEGLQCQSTFCKRQGTCGVCAPRVGAGSSCNSDEQCAPDLVCASGSCVAPGEANASCDDKDPCRADLY